MLIEISLLYAQENGMKPHIIRKWLNVYFKCQMIQVGE
jgi:hypothetical protein